jgi:DNA polymerase-3 subunit gamma/tau
MSTALYRKWRSQTFDEVIGQEHVTKTLRNALRDGRVAHAYLFSGPRGTGKTSTARILAKAINCSAPEAQRPCNTCPTCVAINEGRMLDLIEIDAASNNSVDDVRDLRDKVGFRPSEGRYKIYIIDEVHMLSTSAFNALLKTLEEPPPHARFILATTEPHKIPATVISRCQRFDFRRIPATEIAGHLRHILQEEGYQAEDEALMAIARSAQGCMRDAVSLLDQMLSYGAQTVTFSQVQQSLGAVSTQTVAQFVDTLITRKVGDGLALVQALVTEGVSLVEFCQQVVEHLRGVMLVQMSEDPSLLRDLPSETVGLIQRQGRQIPVVTTLYAIKRFSSAAQDLKGGFQPQLPLEMALIEVVQGAPVVAPAAVPSPVQVIVQTAASHPSAQAPVPVPQATSAQAVPSATTEITPPPLDATAVKRLRNQWKEFLKAVRGQCGFQVEAALNSVRDIAIAEQSVAFAFGENVFARDMVAKPETMAKVVAILANVLGRTVLLDCQTGEHARLAATVRSASMAVSGDGPDPLVEYAVSSLGAEVIE